jgi:NTP pyrophosphatase (non-canonical NTP hydrolase)
MSAAPLGALGRRAASILAGLEHPPLGMAAALAEECGEVARVLLDHHGYGRPLDPDSLGHELADVLVCLFEIAGAHGIDFDRALERRLVLLESQAPRWREELAQALRRARGGPAPPGG